MTDQQIEALRQVIARGRVCVGWDDPAGKLRRIVSIEERDGEPAGVFANGQWCALMAVCPEDIVAYFRPFAVV